MLKYGQPDLANQWQIGFQSFLRLVVLSMLLGAVASFIWWHFQAEEYSFYYLFQYCYSWLYCHIPFGCSEVATYNLQVLQPFVERLDKLIRSCGVVFASFSFISCVGLRYYFVQQSSKLEKARYLRGARLLKPADLNLDIDAARDNQGRLKYEETTLDLYFGKEKIRLPYSLSFRHLATVGISGTGKTQLINSFLECLGSRRGQKCFVLDLNGQYYSRFGQVGDKILSLYDTRSEAWSFYGENVPPEFFASALVEVSEGGNSKFFGNAGRALMTDIISHNDTIEGVWQDLTSPVSELLAKLKDGISPALLGAPEQAAGVIASASVELGFLRHLNYWNKSQDFFSLTDWVLSPSEDWVFVIVKDIDLAAAKPLMRLWFDLVVGGVLQREEKAQYPHLWVVCDELPGLGILPSFGKLLSQGRKYQATMAVGYQVRGQIEQLYGKDQAQEIFAGLQNKFIFRIPEPDSAKVESLTLGEQEVEEVTSNAQLGAGIVEGDRNSLVRAIKTRPVVMAAELQNLADMKAYVKLCEFNPTLITFDYQAYPEINEPTIRQIPPQTQTASQISGNSNLPNSYSPNSTIQPYENENPELQIPKVASSNPAQNTQEGNQIQESEQNLEEDLDWDIDPNKSQHN